MYEITIINGDSTEKLHEMVSGSNRKVAAGNFTDGVNIVPTAQVVIYPQNPVYSHLEPMATRVKFVNTKTNDVEFEGRVLKIPFEGMDNDGVVKKQITFEGLLSYLYDTVQEYAFYSQITTSALLQALITVHNAQFPAGSDQIIDPATCVVTDITEQMSNVEVGYAQTFSEIKRLLLDVYGGELYMKRNAQGKLVLYWMAESDYIAPSDTTIELAKNIKALSVDTDATHIITRLFPYGAKINDTNQRLTIQHADVGGQEWGKTYIDDENAIAQYGVICGVLTNDDIEDATELYQNALKYMQNNNRIRKSYKAQVLDLATIGLEPDALEVGSVYRFKNALIGLDEDLRLVKKTVDIYKPYMPTVEIGDKTEKITSAAARAINFIQYEYPKQQASFLEAAKNTASALINNATKGYIYVDNDNGELLIMDAPEKENAQKVWRWNSGGFGYTPNYQNGQGTFTIAMTMDNTLVADFIMAAHIIAQNLTVTGGKIDITSSSETNDRVSLSYHEWRADLAPLQLKLSNSSANIELLLQAGGIFFKENGNLVFNMGRDGTVAIWNGSNWVTVDLKAISTLWTAVFGGSGTISADVIHANTLMAIDPDLPSGTFRNVMTMLKDHEQRISALENA